ncbi:MAG: hypothetical protein CMH30_07640 [Micavibrio sp.]|nr:hypothetical protein [Micavibrio sp.]|tara:strand:+ start:1315 stop:1629 length:315 start_codon:yes stop_codon:yes gene_type:complete
MKTNYINQISLLKEFLEKTQEDHALTFEGRLEVANQINATTRLICSIEEKKLFDWLSYYRGELELANMNDDIRSYNIGLEKIIAFLDSITHSSRPNNYSKPTEI